VTHGQRLRGVPCTALGEQTCGRCCLLSRYIQDRKRAFILINHLDACLWPMKLFETDALLARAMVAPPDD